MLKMVVLSPGDVKEVEVDREEDIDGVPSGSSIRPRNELHCFTSTAFVAKSPNGRCILLSALNCFLEDEEEVDGVAIEEDLAKPVSRSKKEK